VNPHLLVCAIRAEAFARGKTPVEDAPAAAAAGLTLIADLSIGAALQPPDLFKLSDAPGFRQACLALFRPDPQSWPYELLRAATAASVPREQKARALMLGCKCLTWPDKAPPREELVRAYLVHLTDCDCAMPRGAIKAGPGHCTERQRIPRLSEQLSLLQSLSRREFPGRRVFR
jgi:hypothetical protein